ncbi:hypothetical protein CapIbe_000511 [Capra ibex]
MSLFHQERKWEQVSSVACSASEITTPDAKALKDCCLKSSLDNEIKKSSQIPDVQGIIRTTRHKVYKELFCWCSDLINITKILRGFSVLGSWASTLDLLR